MLWIVLWPSLLLAEDLPDKSPMPEKEALELPMEVGFLNGSLKVRPGDTTNEMVAPPRGTKFLSVKISVADRKEFKWTDYVLLDAQGKKCRLKALSLGRLHRIALSADVFPESIELTHIHGIKEVHRGSMSALHKSR